MGSHEAPRSLCYLTASFKALPGLNRGTLAALILIVLPVCGLRPVRAARLVILNVPNPIRDTGCFFLRLAVMACSAPLTARVAAVLERSADLATASMRSCLFTVVFLSFR